MSTVYSKFGQCISKSGIRKKQYNSKNEAKRRAKVIATITPGMPLLKAYKCPHCDLYHLGNPVPKPSTQALS